MLMEGKGETGSDRRKDLTIVIDGKQSQEIFIRNTGINMNK